MEKDLFSKIISQAWKDEALKEELIRNPKKVLNEYGIKIPENVHVTVCEETDKEVFFVMPQKPIGELFEKDLEAIAGGISYEEQNRRKWERGEERAGRCEPYDG